MNTKTIFSFLLIIFSITACNTTEPPPDGEGINLILEDVSCTKAWITLSTNLRLPATVELKQNNQNIKTINLTKSDSLLLIDSLLPNTFYTFQASSNAIRVKSNELQLKTLDTTSHNFTWQSWTFGEYNSSILNDVAVIDGNNIWAVGEIYLNDSLGQSIRYNAVHWDGNEWKLLRIMFYTVCGQQSRTSYAAKSIFVINNNEIWIAMDGDQVAKMENGIQTLTMCLPWSFSINKIWGSSSNDLYFVGNDGSIVHYQNGQWSRLESGVLTDLLDIYGEGENIFVGGWRDFQPSVLLKLKNGNVQKIIEDENNLFNYRTYFISGAIYSVWITEKKLYVVTWYDLYRANVNTDGTSEAVWRGEPQNWGVISVRGNDVNDIIACGVLGKIWHYNGLNWHTYDELIDSRDRLRRIEIKDNICVAVGQRYENGIEDKALIHVGRR